MDNYNYHSILGKLYNKNMEIFINNILMEIEIEYTAICAVNDTLYFIVIACDILSNYYYYS